MTLHSHKPIAEIIRTGRLEGHPVAACYKYRGIGGEDLYAVFLTPEADDIYQSPYVDQSSIVLLSSSGMATIEGTELLNSWKQD